MPRAKQSTEPGCTLGIPLMSENDAVVFISNNHAWCCDMMDAAGNSSTMLSWPEFDQSSLADTHAARLAVARFDAQADVLDQRLGRLCRAYPHGVVVEVFGALPSIDAQFFAHGFRHIIDGDTTIRTDYAQCGSSDKIMSPEMRCFEYRLSDYKSVPDWLNARYWAHPTRFNL